LIDKIDDIIDFGIKIDLKLDPNDITNWEEVKRQIVEKL